MTIDGYKPGQYAAAFDALLNPQLCAQFAVSVAGDNVEREVLPAPPSGFVWVITNAVYSNQNAATSAYTLRMFDEAGAARIVDQRTAAAGPTYPAANSTLAQLWSPSRLTLQVASNGPIVFAGQAFLLPSALVWLRWFSLTAAEQLVSLEDIPDGAVLRTSTMSFPGVCPGFWQMNTAAAGLIVRARWARGAVTSYNVSGTVAALARGVSTLPLPALKRGDTLALSLSAAPSGPFYFGMCLLVTPELGLGL